MKNAFFTPRTINNQIIGEAEPLGSLPMAFLREGGGNMPSLFSVIDSDNDVANIITGASPISSSASTVNVNVLSGQSIDVELVRSPNWGTVTLAPTNSFASIVSTVGDTVTIRINTTASGSGGDYLEADYNNADYLTTGINEFSGCYDIEVLNDSTKVVDLKVCIYPVSQISTVCPLDVINFAWLNIDGGWSSMAFECKFTNGIEQGRASTFVTSDNVIKINERQDVYDTVEVSANSITKKELDALSELSQSIQAFIYSDTSQAWDVPILIDRSSFTTYGNRFKQGESSVSFSFRKATKKDIQTQ
jgi:hypothetical protein